MLRQWDDTKYTDTVTGYKYTFTFDGAGRYLVVKFANKQDITMDVVTSENLEVFEILEKNAAYFRAEGVRKAYRPEICEVARRTQTMFLVRK